MGKITLTEAASRTGLSVDTLRRRLKAGKLAGSTDNTGRWMIDEADLAEGGTRTQAPPLASMPAAAQAPMQDAAKDELITELRQQRDQLQRRIDGLEDRLHQVEDQARDDMQVERQRADAERDRLLGMVEEAGRRRGWWPFAR